MKTCPICKEKTISLKALAGSNPASPARCSACNSMCFMPGILRNTLEFVPHFGLPFVLIGSLVLANWWPIIIFVVAIPAAYLAAAYLCNPMHTTKEEVKVSKRYDIMLRYLILAVLVGGILWFFL